MIQRPPLRGPEIGMPGMEALIFDVDGTIADTEEVHRRAFNLAFREAGLDWCWDPARYAVLLQVTGGKERMAHFIATLPVADFERRALRRRIPELHSRKNRLYRHLVEQGEASPRVGVRRLMTEARAAGVRLAIASTTSPENISPLLIHAFGTAAPGWFEVVVTGEDVPRKKPAADVYVAAMSAMRLRAGQAIAVEESAIGVRSAKAAGLFTVAIPSSWTRQEDFGGADLVCESLGDPDAPLGESARQRIGAEFLGLAQLQTLFGQARIGGSRHG
jgi:HAD superfamily hydrolase (TIGR01509 family)